MAQRLPYDEFSSQKHELLNRKDIKAVLGYVKESRLRREGKALADVLLKPEILKDGFFYDKLANNYSGPSGKGGGLRNALVRLDRILRDKSDQDSANSFSYLVTQEIKSNGQYIRISKKVKSSASPDFEQDKNFEYYFSRANVLLNWRNFKEAAELFEKALGCSPPSDDYFRFIFNKLIDIYQDLGGLGRENSPNYLKYDFSYMKKFINVYAKMYLFNFKSQLYEFDTFSINKTIFWDLEKLPDESLKNISDDLEELDLNLDELEVLPSLQTNVLYDLACLYLRIDHDKAKDKLRKAILYEYLVFADNDEENVIKWVSNDIEKWSKVESFSIEKLLRFKDKEVIGKIRNKRPFYDYVCSNQFDEVLASILLKEKKISIRDLYAACIKEYDKEKYKPFFNSPMLFIEVKKRRLVLGSEEWFRDWLLDLRKDLIKIDQFENSCEVTEKFMKWYEDPDAYQD